VSESIVRFEEQQGTQRKDLYILKGYISGSKKWDWLHKDIIQCNKMVKVSCIFKGVIRSVKADQRFFKGITAGHF